MEKFDSINFCKEFNISYKITGNSGWVNICCPFCYDRGYHGGIKGFSYNCWKCGSRKIIDFIQAILPDKQSKEIYNTLLNFAIEASEDTLNQRSKVNGLVEFPIGVEELKDRHHKYLRKRGFDSIKLEEKYSLLGTNEYGDFNFRVIIPIYQNNRIVTYTGRDITEKSKIKYKSCPIEKSVISINDVVYGIDTIKDRWCIVVEGVFDAWKLGRQAVATMGVNFSERQINAISKKADFVYILYDNDEAGVKQSRKMRDLLTSLNILTRVVRLDGIKDPGSLPASEAEILVDNLNREKNKFHYEKTDFSEFTKNIQEKQ